MMSAQRRSFVFRLFRPIVLAAGICLLVAGCGTMPDPPPESFESAQILLPKPGSKKEAEAFKEKVKDDPFPEAAEDEEVPEDKEDRQ